MATAGHRGFMENAWVWPGSILLARMPLFSELFSLKGTPSKKEEDSYENADEEDRKEKECKR